MCELLDELWKSRHPHDALFLDIIAGYTINESQYYPDEIFYIKDDFVLIDYNLKTKVAYIRYSLLWSVFETNLYLNHQETRDLMKSMLETHLKLEIREVEAEFFNYAYSLEGRLKLEGTTKEEFQ